MTFLHHVACPCGIIRAVIILAVARILLHPAQSFIFSTTSRLDVFLFVAIFLDIFSRTAGIITELSDGISKEETAGLRIKTSKIIRGLFLSNYGGFLLVPVWVGCLGAYCFHWP
jgi:hypothetical protein